MEVSKHRSLATYLKCIKDLTVNEYIKYLSSYYLESGGAEFIQDIKNNSAITETIGQEGKVHKGWYPEF